MSDQTVLLSKLFSHGGIILAKGQLYFFLVHTDFITNFYMFFLAQGKSKYQLIRPLNLDDQDLQMDKQT